MKSVYFGTRATVDQMTEARALCGNDPVLVLKLGNLLRKQPNERIMQKYIDYLREPTRDEKWFAVETTAGPDITGFRGRRDRTGVMRRDKLTPAFFATGFTVVLETLLVVLFHADPDIHLTNYALAGLLAFGAVVAALDGNVNG